ncbi:unnamed protein product [Effrenium voratum]|nr:unnamed protein product [Effrenium voratum]
MAMAVMRARIKSQGACLSSGMRWRCSLQWPSTESLSAAHEFSRGVPGRKDRNGAPASSQRWLHAGVALRARAAREDNNAEAWGTCASERWACWLSGPARSRGGGGPSEKATSQLGLAQVVAEADRVLEDNGTLKETKAVLRRWSSTWDLLLARQQLKLALAQQEAAQEQEVKAVARLEKAEESGTKEEVEKAERKVEKAERKVEKAERKVERAKKEVQEAKKEVQEAEVKEAKASGRTKESEADGQQAAIEAILSTSWTVCQPAAMKPTLIGREEAKRELLGYICGVRNVTNSTFWEIAPPLGKSSVMVTAGVKGIGKTRLLHEMCTTWLSETAARAALRVDFNGSTWHGRKDPTQAFSQVLLRYAGMRPDDAAWCSEALPWEKVMWALRRKLGLADDALLLVGVDELIELEKKYGLVHAARFGDKRKSVLHPLVLQSWADRHREPLANQIKKMFEEDSVLETTHEKKFEAVMLHFDAAVRLALEKESCTLEQLFPGANLKPESLPAVRVMPGLQYSGDSVVELDSFDDVDEVMSSLEYGSIVVSQKRTEKGIEYLVPWTVPRKDHRQLLRSLQPTGPGDKDPNAHLLILGVQTKYVQEFVGKWPSVEDKAVEDKAQKALAGLRADPRVLQALPIFYRPLQNKLADFG